MRNYIYLLVLLTLMALAVVTPAHAGVIKFTARHTVKPVAKAAYVVAKTAFHIAY